MCVVAGVINSLLGSETIIFKGKVISYIMGSEEKNKKKKKKKNLIHISQSYEQDVLT